MSAQFAGSDLAMPHHISWRTAISSESEGLSNWLDDGCVGVDDLRSANLGVF